ncbi:hypothetical protein FSP39_002620 [Pinctada imbricata]|uniref:Tripartite motif-containing protein 2 n=1 Tax=Pinctada imbricata TaxID=66713 RepID=A0AA88Y1V3_PINIB|nr:hypothetical protein FSP39_002620 [Pinctada imbricata]
MQKHRADKHRKRRKRDKERQRTTQKHQTQRTTHKPTRPMGNRCRLRTAICHGNSRSEQTTSITMNDSQEPCCVRRQVHNHNRHGISSAVEKHLSAEERFNDTAKEVQRDVLPSMDQMADKVKKDRSENRDKISRVREEENDFREEMEQVVDESCNELKVRSFNSKIGVSSITTAGKNIAWVMNCDSDTMYMYDISGEIDRFITVAGSDGINDMVIRRSGETIISCNDRKVRRVSMSGEISTLIDTSPCWPYGICLTDREDVVVCMRGQNHEDHVAVYSPDIGRKLRDIKGMDSQGKQLITHPYRVAGYGKDLCVINSSYAICVNEKDDVRWVYDGKEANPMRPFEPCGIAVDKYNNLLVTDPINACVHYINRDGQLIKIIQTQEQAGLSCPWGICVDDNTGQLWVGNALKNVVICKYLS